MGGRFFSLPFVLAIFILLESPVRLPSVAWLTLIVLIFMLTAPFHAFPLTSNADYSGTPVTLIGDERSHYYPFTDLLNVLKNPELPTGRHRQAGALSREVQQVEVEGAIGITGFYAGPHVYIVDEFGLTDTLLAHLPPLYGTIWRPGHMRHAIPNGYLATLRSGSNQLDDPNLREYYQQLKLIISGPLWSHARLSSIWHMLMGDYDHLIDKDHYRHYYIRSMDYAQIHTQANPFTIPSGINVDFPTPQTAPRLVADLSYAQRWRIEFWHTDQLLAVAQLSALPLTPQPIIQRTIDVPAAAQRQGYTRVRILPASSAPHPIIKHVELLSADQQPPPRLLLGAGWELPDTKTDAPTTLRWASRPPNILIVELPEPTSVTIQFTPVEMFDPALEGQFGSHGQVIVTGPAAQRRYDLIAGEPVQLDFDLPAARSRIELQLATQFARTYTPEGLPIDHSFAVKDLQLIEH